MTSPMPYLPTEITNIIFEYKEAMEDKDKHNSLTETINKKIKDIEERRATIRGELRRMRWVDEHDIFDINSHTACRRCHHISASTLDSEFAENEDMSVAERAKDHPFWHEDGEDR